MISVLILTRNEAADIAGAIRSVAFSDDVLIFDSHSTDDTRRIALDLGANVYERTFDNYAAQRNASLTLPHFRHDWILILDADERPTPELVEEMQAAIRTAHADTAAFRIRRNDYLWGTWLKHAQITPFYTRLVRRGHARYLREINEVIQIDGNIAQLHAPLNHYPFSRGIAHWVDRHNTYSTMEAQLLAAGSATQHASLRTALFSHDPQDRRRAQKALFYRLPCRTALKWLYMVVWRRSFLDGRAGLTYATLQCFYEYLIETKYRDMQASAKQKGLPQETSSHTTKL